MALDVITVRVGPRPGDLGDVLAMHGRAERHAVRQWGHDLVEVRYELELGPNTEGG